MMWVIRAGQDSLYYDKYLETSKVYIPWDGYKLNLSAIETRTDFRTVVEKEKKTDNRYSVSNWAGQLYSFTKEMEKGDEVLIPSQGSHTYCLAKIAGDYCFDVNDKNKLYHSRSIEVIEKDIPREIFSQSVIYSLGAFRTIFKAKHEDEIMEMINKWREARK